MDQASRPLSMVFTCGEGCADPYEMKLRFHVSQDGSLGPAYLLSLIIILFHAVQLVVVTKYVPIITWNVFTLSRCIMRACVRSLCLVKACVVRN